jgi:hypothetical protein
MRDVPDQLPEPGLQASPFCAWSALRFVRRARRPCPELDEV